MLWKKMFPIRLEIIVTQQVNTEIQHITICNIFV